MFLVYPKDLQIQYHTEACFTLEQVPMHPLNSVPNYMSVTPFGRSGQRTLHFLRRFGPTVSSGLCPFRKCPQSGPTKPSSVGDVRNAQTKCGMDLLYIYRLVYLIIRHNLRSNRSYVPNVLPTRSNVAEHHRRITITKTRARICPDN
jgi:hypothetical protein